MTLSVDRHKSIADFTGNVIVTGDGTLTTAGTKRVCNSVEVAGVCAGSLITVPIPIINGFKLEAILPESDRTFFLSGRISNADVQNSRTAFASSPIPDLTAVKCDIPPQ